MNRDILSSWKIWSDSSMSTNWIFITSAYPFEFIYKAYWTFLSPIKRRPNHNIATALKKSLLLHEDCANAKKNQNHLIVSFDQIILCDASFQVFGPFMWLCYGWRMFLFKMLDFLITQLMIFKSKPWTILEQGYWSCYSQLSNDAVWYIDRLFFYDQFVFLIRI